MPAVISTRGIVDPINQRPKGEIKTMKCSQIALAISGALLSICSVSAQQVKTDYDHSANFSQYKTYSWVQVKTSNSLWDGRVKADVNSALVAKGLSEVPTGGDLAVVASRTSQDQQTLNTFYDGSGGGGYGWRGFGRGGFGGGGFGESTTTTETYKVGTLIVDLFDGKTKSLLWRGSASGDLSGNSNNNIKNLDKETEKMFQHFPPNSGKK
jgi:hypothetical protein